MFAPTVRPTARVTSEVSKPIRQTLVIKIKRVTGLSISDQIYKSALDQKAN